MRTANAAAGRTMREFWVAVGLLWLAGVGLRLTILAVPPVILLIQSDLALSGTEVGILSGLPVILFGIAALPGSLLVARFGALATLVAGLLIAGVGVRFARRRAQHIGALCRDHRDERRHRHHAAGVVAAGSPMAAATGDLRHGGLHQRPARRRDACGHADNSARAAVRGRLLAMGACDLGHSARGDRDPGRGARPRAEGGAFVGGGGGAQLVARLQQQADLASRNPFRQREQRLLLRQRVPARPSHRRGSARPDQRRAHRPQLRPGPCVFRAARGRGPARAARLAFHRLRRAHAFVRGWPRHDRKRMDHRFCRRTRLPHRRRAHAGLCTAAAVECAGRRGAHVGGDVHDQL